MAIWDHKTTDLICPRLAHVCWSKFTTLYNNIQQYTAMKHNVKHPNITCKASITMPAKLQPAGEKKTDQTQGSEKISIHLNISQYISIYFKIFQYISIYINQYYIILYNIIQYYSIFLNIHNGSHMFRHLLAQGSQKLFGNVWKIVEGIVYSLPPWRTFALQMLQDTSGVSWVPKCFNMFKHVSTKKKVSSCFIMFHHVSSCFINPNVDKQH